jgi:hypothetical protein
MWLYTYKKNLSRICQKNSVSKYLDGSALQVSYIYSKKFEKQDILLFILIYKFRCAYMHPYTNINYTYIFKWITSVVCPNVN